MFETVSDQTISACGVATIHGECVTDHEARARAAKPKNRCGDLLGTAEPPDRLLLHQFLHGFGLTDQHTLDHRRFDDPRAHRVDADSPCCIYTAEIPKALIVQLERLGLASLKTTQMGNVVGQRVSFFGGGKRVHRAIIQVGLL
jgi:hypothetical protein